jgi:hypothetical protein
MVAVVLSIPLAIVVGTSDLGDMTNAYLEQRVSHLERAVLLSLCQTPEWRTAVPELSAACRISAFQKGGSRYELADLPTGSGPGNLAARVEASS